MLKKTCPYCGGPSFAEAKLPVSNSLSAVEYNLDDLGALVENQSLSLLLALVELLPYKMFACRKCHNEFRMENQTGKELIRSMLANMKPVIPIAPPKRSKPRPIPLPSAIPDRKPPVLNKPEQKGDWEPESLDSLFDYSTDTAKK
jgi:hypothetical protein